jgi:hypothetical protein
VSDHKHDNREEDGSFSSSEWAARYAVTKLARRLDRYDAATDRVRLDGLEVE